MRVSARLSSPVNAKGWTLLPLGAWKAEVSERVHSVSQGGSGMCFSGDSPSCPHLLCLGLHHGAVSPPGVLSAGAEPADVLQEQRDTAPANSPSRATGISPQHQLFLLKMCSYCTVLPAKVVTAQIQRRWGKRTVWRRKALPSSPEE